MSVSCNIQRLNENDFNVESSDISLKTLQLFSHDMTRIYMHILQVHVLTVTNAVKPLLDNLENLFFN